MLTWINNHNTHSAKVGEIGDLVVTWSMDQENRPGYYVIVFRNRLKITSPNLEAGKTRAINSARRLLNDAIKCLDFTPEDEPK